MRYLWLVVLAGMVAAIAWPLGAETNLQVYQTLQLDQTPIDLVVSTESRRMYILTDKGELLIYDVGGQLKDRLQVGKDVRQIKPGPREDTLYLLSAKPRTIRLIVIETVEAINIQGAPFKGPADAAVTLVVFSDFQ
jgi:hypothetical protein